MMNIIKLFKALILLLITLFFLSLGIAKGQEMSYHFEAGQILEFKRTTLPEHVKFPSKSNTNKQTDVFQFRVDSVLDDAFQMTIIHKLKYYNVIKQFRTTGTIFKVYSPYSDSLSYEPNTDWIGLDMEVRFKLSKLGLVSNIEGNNEILEKYINTIRNVPTLWSHVPYEYVDTRFGEASYQSLINEFFPVLQKHHKQDFKIDKLTLKLVTTSKIISENPERIKVSYTQSSEVFGPNQPSSMTWPISDSSITAIWNTSRHYFEFISYTGPHTREKITNLGTIALHRNWYEADPNQVETGYTSIELIKDQQQSDQAVTIKGTIYGGRNNYFYTYLPAEITVPEVWSKEMIGDTTYIDLSFELKNGPIILNSYIWNSKKQIYPGSVMEGGLNLYLEPGDTVFFEWYFNDSPTTLSFDGTNKEEQDFLRKFHYPMPYPGTHSDEGLLLKNEESLKIKDSSLSIYFLTLLKEEQLYFKLSRRINAWKRLKIENNKAFNDSILKILPFMGNELCQNSEVYKLFVENFLELVEPDKIANHAWATPMIDQEFHYAELHLRGWDLYWYLARLTESNLSRRPSTWTGVRLNKFHKKFPGTEFAQKLQKKAETIKYGTIGAKFPKIKLISNKGKQIKSSKFNNTNLIVFQFNAPKDKSFLGYANERVRFIGSMPFRRNKPDEDAIATLSSLNKKSKQELSFLFLMDKKNDTLIRDLQSKFGTKSVNVIYRDKNREFFEMYENLKQSFVLYNYDGKMVMNDLHLDSYLSNYLSWPLEVTKIEKTVAKTTVLTIVGLILFVSILGMIILRLLMRRKQKKAELNRKISELELNAVRARMNPHFLFNALNSIQLLVNSGNTDKANTYLVKFAHLIRQTMNQSSRTAISLQEEIDALDTYIQLEQLRFPFKKSIEIDPELNTELLEVPPLLIQPHVENSIWHGISDLGSKGFIRIKIKQVEQNLIILVEDNGPGIKSPNEPSNGLGQGWKITRQRLELLKNQWGEQLEIEIINTDESKGMIVKFTIPIENDQK